MPQGGALCPQKSFWYLISWTWSKAGTAKLATTAVAPGTLNLTSGSSTETVIAVPRVEPSATYRTLGVRLSPRGQTKQVTTLGDWTSATHQQWQQYVCPLTQTLFLPSTMGWHVHPIVSQTSRRPTRSSRRPHFSTFPSDHVTVLPPTVVPATAQLTR